MDRPTSIAAGALLTARKTGIPIVRLPPGSEPTTIGEAYAIQDEVSRQLSPIMGWKVGPSRPNPGIFTAPLFKETFVTAPSVSVAHLKQPLFEAELAFRLREAIPAAAIPSSAFLDLLDLIPLFEILGSRFTNIFETPMLSLVADNNASAFIVPGPIVKQWHDIPSDRALFRIEVDGKILHEFNYAEKLKEGIELATAVIRSVDGRTRALSAGTVITTGSIIKPIPATGNITANYGPLGIHKINIHS